MVLKTPLTIDQQIALAIVPKLSAAFSMIGSSYIIMHVLLNPNRRKRVYHRILLGMGFMDIVSSFKYFLSTWPLPEGIAWGAVGTTETCTAAGFFGHGASLAGPLYNGSLTLYYFLTIRDRDRWREERIRSIEPWLHTMPLFIGWSTAIAGLPLKLYNPIGWTCWIGPWPPRCKQAYKFGQTTCMRGDNADIYRWAFFHGELWLTFFLTFLGMALIYRAVARCEQKTNRWNCHDTVSGDSAGENEGDRRKWRRWRQGKHARKVMVQAALFLAAFYLTWIFPTITFMTQSVRGETYTIVLFLQAIFIPLQGAFNALIYLRPRYLRNRERYPEEGIRGAMWRTLREKAPPARNNECDSVATGDSSGNWKKNVRRALPSLSLWSFAPRAGFGKEDEGDHSSAVCGGGKDDYSERSDIKNTFISHMGMEGNAKEEWKSNKEAEAVEGSSLEDNGESVDQEEFYEELVD